jgi:hypothetical protein
VKGVGRQGEGAREDEMKKVSRTEHKVSTAELKKAILAVQAERLKHPARSRPDRAQRATLQKSRRESEKTYSAFLKKAGLDLKKFQAQQEKRSSELERMVAKHKADSLKVAAARKDTLNSSIAAQSKALSRVAVEGGFQVYQSFTLDTPFLIWSNPLIDISSAAVPFGSWAKFNFSMSTSQSGSQNVSFYFYWRNPYKDYALINVATFMSATGYLRAHAPWAVGTSVNEVDAYADLIPWFGLPDTTTTFGSEVAFLGSIGAYGNIFGGDTEGVSISSGVSLSSSGYAVAPSTTAVFEVTLVVDYDNRGGGDIEADFESGDFQIACPAVVVWLLNHPPGSVAA